MLRVEEVSVAYGRSTAVREASLTVNKGEIVTLIGANGAGKTSLLNAISGVIPLTNGSIRLDDRPIQGFPSHKTVRLGMSYVPEGRQIFGGMSVTDNLILGAYSDCASRRLSIEAEPTTIVFFPRRGFPSASGRFTRNSSAIHRWRSSAAARSARLAPFGMRMTMSSSRTSAPADRTSCGAG